MHLVPIYKRAGPLTIELLLWYCLMLGQPATTGTKCLTVTHIFSGRKAKINLHTTPKLTVVMPTNCLLRSFQFPSSQNYAIILHLCLFSCNFVVCFQWSPAIKLFLELTDCCLVYQSFLLFVFAFFNHSIKIAQFLFAGDNFFSFPSHCCCC